MDSQLWRVIFQRVRRLYLFFVLGLVLGSTATAVKAQSYLENVGVPPFTTALPVESGFINAANGNLHLEIPLGSFPQRSGPPDNIVLMYDSALWSHANLGPWQATNIGDPNGYAPVWGGWRILTSRDGGQTTFSERDTDYCAKASDYTYARYSPWYYVAPDGTQHTFPVTTVEPLYPGQCGTSGTPTAAGYANDGSGFYISITTYTAATVYAPDGTILGGGSKDTNGNYASNGVDTLGRTVLTQTNNSGVYTLGVPNAQGGTSYYTVRTGPIYVCTNFGEQNVGEWCNPTSPYTITVVNEVDLPDGAKYTFNYDSGTTAGHYGLLTQMTLPTGGQISYSFAVQTDAAGNHYNWINSRTTPDGTWTYGFQTLNTCASGYVDCQQTFTVTKPLVPPATTNANQTVYTFTVNGGDWPTQVQYYTGSTTNGTLLATTTQCFNFVNVTAGSCSYSVVAAAPGTNVHLLATTTTLPIPGNSATTEYAWDGYGNKTSVQEWNFGNSPSNPADRTTTITYLTGTAYQPPNANILNRPTNITVTDNAGTTVAQTLYGYDVYTYNGGSLAGVTATGHDTNYGTNIIARGNVTSIQKLVSGSTYLNSYFNYDTTGQVTNAFDPNNQKTTSAYGCQNAYATTITNVVNQVATLGYDCNTGLLTSITDLNNQTTSFTYDNMARPLTTSYPDGGQTSASYNYNGSIYTGTTTSNKITSSQSLATTNNVDSLGRVTSSVLTSDPDGSTTVTTAYDTNGRILKVSNPWRQTSDPTYGFDTYAYDGLNRVQQVTHADGHVSSTYYGASVGSQGGATTQLCASGTYGTGYPVLKIDEANNKLQSWIDGLGRRIEADEPTATSASLTANTCYKYDLNNNLVGVLAAQVNGVNQTRTYIYDGVSRLISKNDPESGTTTYTWDSDSTMCGGGAYTSNGNLVKITDAAGGCIIRYFDVLNRLTDVGSPSGCQRFRYDNTNGVWGSIPSGLTISNPLGRLVEAETDTCAGGQSSMITDQWSSFDPMGRVKLNRQCTSSCGTLAWTLNYGYDLLGDMTSYTNGAGVTFTQAFGGAGRLTGVTSSLSDSNHPGTLLTNVHYNALGETASATLGNGAVETLGYTPRGWPQSATVQSESTGTPGRGTVTINGSDQSHTQNGYSSSQGPDGSSSAADGGGGNIVWNNPTSVETSGGVSTSDTVRLSPTYLGSFYTDNLVVQGFGFNVPTNATINGVVLTIANKDFVQSNPGDGDSGSDGVIELFQGGSYSVNKANADWSTATYGSSTDTWSMSLTPAVVNSPNFGALISGTINYNGLGSGYNLVHFNCGYVTLTIYYTVPPVTTYDSGSVTVTVNGSTTQPVQYNSSSTGASLAGQLATNISALGFVTASNNGTNVITIQSTTNGTSTNYPLSASSQSSNGFNPPSFTAACNNVSPCPSGASLGGGTGAPGTLYSFSLGYGSGNSNVTSANDSVNGNWLFTYDYLNRVSTSNQNNQNGCSYGYDQLGNRTSQTATAGSCGHLSLSYTGNNNRMDGYSYDPAGNLLGDGTHTYAYDAENRLISVDSGNTASYVYDAEGRRVQKKTTAQVEYLYDLNGNIVTELSSTGAWNRGEIFANGRHLATYVNSTTYFDHADWLGTERARSDMTGANCETITNATFGDGQSLSGTGSNCVDANPLHFTGQQWDSESGLHYFPARHYSPQFGRFMSPDPTGIFLGNLNDPQSLNLYAYVRNNPLKFTDPSGLCNASGDCAVEDKAGAGLAVLGLGDIIYVDGLPIPSANVGSRESLAQCPNNFCSGFASDGTQMTFLQYKAFAGLGGQGYVALTPWVPDPANSINEINAAYQLACQYATSECGNNDKVGVTFNGGTYNILLYNNPIKVDSAKADGWIDPFNSKWHPDSKASFYLGNPFFGTGHVVDDINGTGAHYDDAGPLNPFHAIFAIWGLPIWGGGQETKYTCSVSGGCHPATHP